VFGEQVSPLTAPEMFEPCAKSISKMKFAESNVKDVAYCRDEHFKWIGIFKKLSD
jgi:hypothetical protein